MYDYSWDGLGLTIYTPAGECYLQGDEANDTYDALELIEDNEILESVLSGYEHVCE